MNGLGLMPLLRLDNASLHYGNLVLLDAVSVKINKGDKIGLLGRNGAGKTTLLRVLAADIIPESGEHWLRPGTRVAWLHQELPGADQQTVYEVVASGLAETGRLLADYHQLVQQDLPDMKTLARVQQQLEALDGWRLQQRVEATISQLELPANASMSELSGGWRRKAALAQALVSSPDILLLDEPTNHLDIPAIHWLEDQLRNFKGALVLITHDRRFLQNVAGQMAELDRGHLTLWQGGYQGFLRHREQQLLAEERANNLFDRKLAQEEVWIRQGIKARRTRNEGRVRALKALREERGQRRERVGTAGFVVEDAAKSGKIVAELKHVGHKYDDKLIINDFSTIIQRGDRIGIVGSNGAGKTTLVKIILGELRPSSGSVKPGTKLEIAYSDQLRGQLDPEKSLIDNVCGGQEFVDIGGRRRHAISYLSEFLFSPQRARMAVKALSGGEQNRAVLARLFSKSANLLVLDEPTNDLDIETLELLEDILLNFEGTVLLVSHDRDFMDNVITSLIVLDGEGGAREYVGGYSDWYAKGGRLSDLQTDSAVEIKDPATATRLKKRTQQKRPKTKLSYNDQRELAKLPLKIERLEENLSGLETLLSAPGFYQSDGEDIRRVNKQLSAARIELEHAFKRWEELEAKS